MARALSVCDGKEAHSTFARNPTGSLRGNEWAGYCAAIVSALEKSRQIRQVIALFAAARVATASICAMDGLAVCGTGGGPSGLLEGSFGAND